ncbi:hypothetical protein [Phytohabitans houttuyneae]|uniref:Uncharacterized protein n=1 Tax=Phytohabitans houttuyneae TaxID=1076126 RepID=A0A6V8K6R7_9ACTN|nr:hypothetical protein [Phytohabitans houttuyneae]GFJ79454.1 hypothetical protein Phou_036340 [Phytohabitans houttuyneae]
MAQDGAVKWFAQPDGVRRPADRPTDAAAATTPGRTPHQVRSAVGTRAAAERDAGR